MTGHEKCFYRSSRDQQPEPWKVDEIRKTSSVQSVCVELVEHCLPLSFHLTALTMPFARVDDLIAACNPLEIQICLFYIYLATLNH